MEKRMDNSPVRVEKRTSSRTRLDGEVECGIVAVDPAELHDISPSGIRFKSLKRLNPNSTQKIVLHFNNSVLNLRGTIVRSLISASRMIEGEQTPVYEVALNFEQPLKNISQVIKEQ